MHFYNLRHCVRTRTNTASGQASYVRLYLTFLAVPTPLHPVGRTTAFDKSIRLVVVASPVPSVQAEKTHYLAKTHGWTGDPRPLATLVSLLNLISSIAPLNQGGGGGGEEDARSR